MSPLLNPAAVRADQLVDVDLGDGVSVKARKLDLSMMLMEGALPMPLLTAARQLVEKADAPPDVKLEGLEREDVLKTLRAHAVMVVSEPVIVPEDDHNPNHLPVQLLTFPQLMVIWNQTAVLPKVGAADAAEFRQRADVHAPDVVHARQDVRTTAKQLDRLYDEDGLSDFRGA